MKPEQTLLLVLSIATILGLIYYSQASQKSSSNSEPEPETPLIETAETAETAQTKLEAPPAPKIVLFYAPWCGHCKGVLPVWDSLSKIYPNIEKVDCDANKEIAQKEEVRGFPTIRAYTNSGVVEYQGDRSQDDLEKFINSF